MNINTPIKRLSLIIFCLGFLILLIPACEYFSHGYLYSSDYKFLYIALAMIFFGFICMNPFEKLNLTSKLNTPSKRVGFIVFLIGLISFSVLCYKCITRHFSYGWQNSFEYMFLYQHKIWTYTSLIILVLGICIMIGFAQKMSKMLINWVRTGNKNSS